MSKSLRLIPSGVALVDDDDFERLSKYRWYLWNRGIGHEVTRNLPGWGKGSISLRREIVVAPANHDIAFVNGDRLDHRKENLFAVHHGGSALLSKKREGKLIGVYLRKNGIFYSSKRLPSGQLKHIGCFDTSEEAAAAYDLFVVRHFGREVVLNFPENVEAYVAMIRNEASSEP